MKVLRPLSAASVAVALSPAVVTAFSPGVTRQRNYGGGHFAAAQVVSPINPPMTVLHSEAIPLDSADHHRHLSPAQSRSAAEHSSQAFYRRSQHTDSEWADLLQTDPLLSHIRSELVSKYVALGSQWSQAEATKEVDAFLNDEDRSGEFIEMRRYAFVRRLCGRRRCRPYHEVVCREHRWLYDAILSVVGLYVVGTQTAE